jgi:hypothetical protein
MAFVGCSACSRDRDWCEYCPHCDWCDYKCFCEICWVCSWTCPCTYDDGNTNTEDDDDE